MGKDLCCALGKGTTVRLTASLSHFWHPCLLFAKEKKGLVSFTQWQRSAFLNCHSCVTSQFACQTNILEIFCWVTHTDIHTHNPMAPAFACNSFIQCAFTLHPSFTSNSLKHKAFIFCVGTDFSFRAQLICSLFNGNVSNFWVSLTFCIELLRRKSLCVQFRQLNWFTTRLVYIPRLCQTMFL